MAVAQSSSDNNVICHVCTTVLAIFWMTSDRFVHGKSIVWH